MNEFEEFSKDVKNVADQHPRYWIFRALGSLECWLRMKRNTPLPFKLVSLGEGETVSGSLKINHTTLHCDTMPHKARRTLTEKVLLEGLKVNAFTIIAFKKLGKCTGESTIQPMWVEPQKIYLIALFFSG